MLIADGGAWVPFTMRVDQAPFDDVRVRQAMRLIVDRQAMIDQTLSGYGSLGNDLYAPLDVDYASDLPQREQDIDQAKSLLAVGRPGRAAGRAVHRRRHRLGGRSGREPLRRAGQGGRRRGQGHQEDAVLRRRLPVLHVRPGLLEHPQLHPAGRGRDVPARTQGGTYNETHWDNEEHRDLVNAAAQEVDEAKRDDLLHQAQEIEYNEGGLIIWGFRQQVDGYAANVQGLEPSKYLPLGNYKFNKVSV